MNTWLHLIQTGVIVYAVGVAATVAGAFIWGRDKDPANKGMEWENDVRPRGPVS